MAHIRVYLNEVLLDQIAIGDEALTIGRGTDCKLRIENAGVSTLHASIEKVDNDYVIIDNDSTNGVYVNGTQVTRHTLKYWDEIQLYNYVLKFMATAALEESEDPDVATDADANLDRTMEVNLSNVQDLMKLREQKKDAYLDVPNAEGGRPRIFLQDATFTIGRSKAADLRTSGWFAPAIAAEIERHTDGYYLVSHKRGRTSVNGSSPAQRVKLTDGDNIVVRNIYTTFYHRKLSPQN